MSSSHGETASADFGGMNVTVFEVVAEFKRVDDEWMYQLEEVHGGSGSKKSMSSEITQAMTRILRGEFGEAAATLQIILSRLDSKRSLRQDGITTTPSGSSGSCGFPHRMLDYCEQQLLQ